MLTRLLPVLLAVGYAALVYAFSVWRTKQVLTRKSHPLRDAEIGAQVARLARALDLPEIAVHVFEVDPVNGLAAPDGRVFLTEGFVRKYHQGAVSAEEIAGVIAHELGHVALGHSRRRMIDFTGANAVFVILTALLSRFLPFVGVFIANAISGALMARLSRKDEFEADAWASALLLKAGIGTGPQKTLLRKLESLTGTRSEDIPTWVMSHPRIPDRIAAIEANEARWLGNRGLPDDGMQG